MPFYLCNFFLFSSCTIFNCAWIIFNLDGIDHNNTQTGHPIVKVQIFRKISSTKVLNWITFFDIPSCLMLRFSLRGVVFVKK